MLRVFKHKMKQEKGSDGASETDAGAETDMRIVSHIPVTDPQTSASISSLSSAAESSLSSAQYHAFQSLTRHDECETYDGERGPGLQTPLVQPKATVSVDSNGPMSQSKAKVNTHGFARSVSFVSGDVPQGREPKRRGCCHDAPNRSIWMPFVHPNGP